MPEKLDFSSSDPKVIEFLKKTCLFSEVSDEDVLHISSLMTRYKYEEEEVVFTQGEMGDQAYIIESGKCVAERMGRCLKMLSPMDVFGEVSMLAERPHSGTVKALKETILLCLPGEYLDSKYISHDALAKIFKQICRQLTSYINEESALYREMDVLLIQDGGCAPGYNPATSFTVQFLEEQNRNVYIAAEGFKSVVQGRDEDFRCLLYNRLLYKQLEHIPGVLHAPPLREERGARFRTERYPEFMKENLQEQAAKNIMKRQVRVIVGIGGNGTFMGISSLAKLLPQNVQIFFIPVTIDGDISHTECIGQHTGVEVGAEKIRCYMADARTHSRCYIVEMMGARGGYHALHSCLGAGAHLAVLPGHEYDIKKIAISMKDRDYTVIVVAEGYKKQIRDELGFKGNTAEFFHHELLEAGLKTRQRIVCEGFSRDIRGATPNNMDITLAQRMARKLTQLIQESKTLMMPGVLSGKEEGVAFGDIRTSNTVSIELVELANRLGSGIILS